MNLFSIAVATLAMASLQFLPASAQAASITAEKPVDLQFIVIRGEIVSGDDLKFRRVASQYRSAVVVLQSPGGSLLTALDIGRVINLNSYATAAPSSACASACALIWLAGARRYLDNGSEIGFHAGYRDSGGRQIEDGVVNAMIGRYLTQLNLPETAIVFATSAGPREMRWLDPSKPGLNGIAFQNVDDVNQQQAVQRDAFKQSADSEPRRASAPEPPSVLSPPEPPVKPDKLNLGVWTLLRMPKSYSIETRTSDRRRWIRLVCTHVGSCNLESDFDLNCDEGKPYSVTVTFDGKRGRKEYGYCQDYKLGGEPKKLLSFSNWQSLFEKMIDSKNIRISYENGWGQVRFTDFSLVGLERSWATLAADPYKEL